MVVQGYLDVFKLTSLDSLKKKITKIFDYLRVNTIRFREADKKLMKKTDYGDIDNST